MAYKGWEWQEERPFYWNYLKKKMREGFSPILVIVGKPRSGKTYIGLRIAYDMDAKFDIKKSYYLDLLKFVNDMEHLSGRTIVIDEVGVKLDPYKWSSIWNRAFNYIIQTQALKHNCFILCVPHIKYVASAHRSMVDLIAKVTSRGNAKFYLLQTDWAEMRPNRGIYKVEADFIRGFPPPPKYITKEFKEIEAKEKKEIMLDIKAMVNETRRSRDDLTFNPKAFIEALRQKKD